MKRFLLYLAIALLSPATVIGQCTFSSPFGSLTADTTVYTPQSITTCNYAGEYSTIALQPGTWTFVSEFSSDFLTLTNTSNGVIDTATGPLTYTAASAMSVRLHVATNSACGTQSTCRETSVIYSACSGGTFWTSFSASNNFNLQTVELCNYAGEYNNVTLPTGGQWTFSTDESTDFLMITNQSNVPISQGTTPVSITLSGPQTVRMHIYSNSDCGTQSSCRESYVQKSPCLASTAFGSATTSATFFDSTQISSCNYAGEYATVNISDPGNFVFYSSDTGDVLVITTTSNDFLASGQTPLVYNSAGGETVRVHYFTDENCGTESVCRITGVYRYPCLATSQYPSGVDTANNTPEPNQVTTCNWAGEYYEIYLDTGTFLFESDENDMFYFTDTNNNFFFYSASPATGTVTGGPLVVRVHIFADSACTEENVCRTTTVTCLTCPVPGPEVVPADTAICFESGPLTLTATNPWGDQTYWYTTCGGTPIDSGSTIQVSPGSTTTYYAANKYDSLFSSCDTAVVTVNQNPAIDFPNVSDALCNGDSSGMATVNVNGGTQPYTFLWSDGFDQAMNTGLAAGQYTVTVTDDNGCFDDDTVTISEPDSLLASLGTAEDALCNGDSSGSITVSVNGGTSPYLYSWSNGSSTSSTGNVTAGSYTVTILDDNGCSTTFSSSISEPTAITNSFTIDDAVCETSEDGSVATAAAGGVSPYTYLWSNGGTSTSLSNVQSGLYLVTITDDNDCEFVDSATIGFDFADPVIQLDSAMKLCDGFEITLDAGNAGATFAWSTGETTQSIVVDAGGNYSVSVTNGDGCTADQTVDVYVEDCVGIDEFGSLATVETYPNPTRGQLNIRVQNNTSDAMKIRLMSLSGQLIEARVISASSSDQVETLDLSGLSQGVYQINFSLGNRSVTKRIVLQ